MNFNTFQRLSCPSRAWDRYCDDHPDPWDHYCQDDFTEVDLVSECCEYDVIIAKNGANICANCLRFCRINDGMSMDKLVTRITKEEEY